MTEYVKIPKKEYEDLVEKYNALVNFKLEEKENTINTPNYYKQKYEEQTKTFQKILQVQQNEIDQLERNCDVFDEQMNDAVERTVELNKEKQDLKEWLEEEIKNCNPNPQLYFKAEDNIKKHLYKEVLERLG